MIRPVSAPASTASGSAAQADRPKIELQDAGRISADAEERRVAEGELATEAGEHVPGDRQQRRMQRQDQEVQHHAVVGHSAIASTSAQNAASSSRSARRLRIIRRPGGTGSGRKACRSPCRRRR